MADNQSFYIEIVHPFISCANRITEQGDWHFINASNMNAYGKGPNWKRGK